MSDRLEELRRQRALLQHHLDRLDAEISAATPTPAQSIQSGSEPADAQLAESIAAQENAPTESAQQAKRGCIVAFVLLLATLGLAALGWYLLFRAKH